MFWVDTSPVSRRKKNSEIENDVSVMNEVLNIKAVERMRQKNDTKFMISVHLKHDHVIS